VTALRERTRRALQGHALRPVPGTSADQASSPVELSVPERHQLIDLWCQLMSEVYVHYEQKKALYGYDIVRALTALRRQIPYLDSAGFLRELTHAINRLRDQHTQLYLPGPDLTRTPLVAALPFLVEVYGEEVHPTYVVSKVADTVGSGQFRPGVRLTTWNGVPFARTLDLFADTLTGGRPDARRARALETITQRPLAYLPQPDELRVDIGYRTDEDLDGPDRSIRFRWRAVDPTATLQPPSIIELRTRRAIDATSEAARRARKLLFQPELWQDDHSATGRVARGAGWMATAFPDAVSARHISTSHGTYGYLRLWTFDLNHSEQYLNEVARILRDMPETGLIVDLRSNPGGVIEVAERLLQLFTATRVEPVRFALRATSTTAALTTADGNGADLADWAPSVRTALELGEEYSLHLPISDPDRCNGHPVAYRGPVLAIVNPNTFSSGDIFAAGLADHGIADIVAIGEGTGAGGANVWSKDDIEYAYHVAGLHLPECPAGISYSLAVRRAARSGTSAGLTIEDIGITGDDHYTMTKNDVLGHNDDLLEYCSQLLHNR
jgi:hypothetical protein